MSGAFNRSNHLEFKTWLFKTDLLGAMNQIDRFFYLRYNQPFLEEVESARAARKGSNRTSFLKIKQKIEESQFVTEYEGISSSINAIPGHREKMTKQIYQAYRLITGSSPNPKEQTRFDINQLILSTPFGGLEVAYNLVNLVSRYQNNGTSYQSKKLRQIYELEIWKWVWYWTVTSHGIFDPTHYDVFQVLKPEQKYAFSGTTSSKIAKILSFTDNISEKTIQRTLREHVLCFLLSVQDFLLKKETEENEPEKYFSEKEMLEMLSTRALSELDKAPKVQPTSKDDVTVEQQMLFVLDPFHSARLKKTLRFFYDQRPSHHLAWQVKLLPDSNLYNIIRSLNEDRRKDLRDDFESFSKKRKSVSEREKVIITKLDGKISRPVAATSSRKKEDGPEITTTENTQSINKAVGGSTQKIKSIEKNKTNKAEHNIEKNKTNKAEHKNGETIKIPELQLGLPYIIELHQSSKSFRISTTNLAQLLLIDDFTLYKRTIQFLIQTKQLKLDKKTIQFLWSNRKKLVNETLAPMEKVTVQDLSEILQNHKESPISWSICVPILRHKFGYTAQNLRDFEAKSAKLLASPIPTQLKQQGLEKDIIAHYLKFGRSEFEKAMKLILSHKLLKTSEEKNIILACWNLASLSD
jgi:hypothetical protein